MEVIEIQGCPPPPQRYCRVSARHRWAFAAAGRRVLIWSWSRDLDDNTSGTYVLGFHSRAVEGEGCVAAQAASYSNLST
jgi:hypothetical protein